MLNHDTLNGLLTIGIILFVIIFGVKEIGKHENFNDDDDYFNLN